MKCAHRSRGRPRPPARKLASTKGSIHLSTNQRSHTALPRTCGSRKSVVTVNWQIGAHVITPFAAHSDDATHPLLGLPESVQAPAVGPATLQDNPYPAPGACANDGHTGSTRSGAVSDVARAGQSRGPGIRGEYSRSA